ncbi:MAG: hypothetical protein KF889_25410 [Alphaproteobacteria bacterium]|nr:hypothetical protein [Alphaproteobacteria bacterium]MCW5739668.1 hypothetical protein [Alphaproteobacteria bacterium]
MQIEFLTSEATPTVVSEDNPLPVVVAGVSIDSEGLATTAKQDDIITQATAAATSLAALGADTGGDSVSTVIAMLEGLLLEAMSAIMAGVNVAAADATLTAFIAGLDQANTDIVSILSDLGDDEGGSSVAQAITDVTAVRADLAAL